LFTSTRDIAWHTFIEADVTLIFVFHIKYAIANAAEIVSPSLQYNSTLPLSTYLSISEHIMSKSTAAGTSLLKGMRIYVYLFYLKVGTFSSSL
jgi:hypothetical protein